MFRSVNAQPTRVTRRTALTALAATGCTFTGFVRIDGLMYATFTGSVKDTNAAFAHFPKSGLHYRRDDPSDRRLSGAPGKWHAPLRCKAAYTRAKIIRAARAEFEGKGWAEARIVAALEMF